MSTNRLVGKKKELKGDENICTTMNTHRGNPANPATGQLGWIKHTPRDNLTALTR